MKTKFSFQRKGLSFVLAVVFLTHFIISEATLASHDNLFVVSEDKLVPKEFKEDEFVILKSPTKFEGQDMFYYQISFQPAEDEFLVVKNGQNMDEIQLEDDVLFCLAGKAQKVISLGPLTEDYEDPSVLELVANGVAEMTKFGPAPDLDMPLYHVENKVFEPQTIKDALISHEEIQKNLKSDELLIERKKLKQNIQSPDAKDESVGKEEDDVDKNLTSEDQVDNKSNLEEDDTGSKEESDSSQNFPLFFFTGDIKKPIFEDILTNYMDELVNVLKTKTTDDIMGKLEEISNQSKKKDDGNIFSNSTLQNTKIEIQKIIDSEQIMIKHNIYMVSPMKEYFNQQIEALDVNRIEELINEFLSTQKINLFVETITKIAHRGSTEKNITIEYPWSPDYKRNLKENIYVMDELFEIFFGKIDEAMDEQKDEKAQRSIDHLNKSLEQLIDDIIQKFKHTMGKQFEDVLIDLTAEKEAFKKEVNFTKFIYKGALQDRLVDIQFFLGRYSHFSFNNTLLPIFIMDVEETNIVNLENFKTTIGLIDNSIMSSTQRPITVFEVTNAIGERLVVV